MSVCVACNLCEEELLADEEIFCSICFQQMEDEIKLLKAKIAELEGEG